MATTTRFQRKYDHRLRELVRATGNVEVALKHGVPPSTARGWVKATIAEVVTIDVADMNQLLNPSLEPQDFVLQLSRIHVERLGGHDLNARRLQPAARG